MQAVEQTCAQPHQHLEFRPGFPQRVAVRGDQGVGQRLIVGREHDRMPGCDEPARQREVSIGQFGAAPPPGDAGGFQEGALDQPYRSRQGKDPLQVFRGAVQAGLEGDADVGYSAARAS